MRLFSRVAAAARTRIHFERVIWALLGWFVVTVLATYCRPSLFGPEPKVNRSHVNPSALLGRLKASMVMRERSCRRTGLIVHFKENSMRSLVACAVALVSILAGMLSGASAQQPYPARPITVVVPFAAGGPTDVLARILGQHMSQTLGQQIVVENVTGAGGSIGAARVAKAAPDGYTMVMGNLGTHAAAVGLYKNLSYDPRIDF